MARPKTHKDVEFAVEDFSGKQRTFKKFDEAAGFAVQKATSGRSVDIDVLIWSAAGARWWGGDDGVYEYKQDPDASVFERISIRADSQGKVS